MLLFNACQVMFYNLYRSNLQKKHIVMFFILFSESHNLNIAVVFEYAFEIWFIIVAVVMTTY